MDFSTYTPRPRPGITFKLTDKFWQITKNMCRCRKVREGERERRRDYDVFNRLRCTFNQSPAKFELLKALCPRCIARAHTHTHTLIFYKIQTKPHQIFMYKIDLCTNDFILKSKQPNTRISISFILPIAFQNRSMKRQNMHD